MASNQDWKSSLAELQREYHFLHNIAPKESKWGQGDPSAPPRVRIPTIPRVVGPEPVLKAIPRAVKAQAASEEQAQADNSAGDLSDTNEMPGNKARASRVQQLLEHNPLHLGAYQVANPDLPLQFQLVQSAAELEKSELDACFKLVEKTSSNDYKSSSIGWKPKKKREEMSDEDMIYLLVRGGGAGAEDKSTISGFVSFMFTNDDPPHEDREVLYIYEIHLEDGLRGRGLGSKLIQFVEMASRECGITKTMMTVFASNTGARGLYEKLGYGKDSCSPEDKVVRNRVIEADYVIMSKELE
jgi:ribosomal protein S18 acetylase RimI-like enzyme